MDTTIRQAVLHLYLVIWSYFTLRLVRDNLIETFPAIGTWVNKRRATNRDNQEVVGDFMMAGTDSNTSLSFGVCDSFCGMATNLLDLKECKREIFPRSCEHCYACGMLLKGSYERGCVIHLKMEDGPEFYCPDWDFSSTELFLDSLKIVGVKMEISDSMWNNTLHLVEEHPEASPEGLATIIFATPDNYGE